MLKNIEGPGLEFEKKIKNGTPDSEGTFRSARNRAAFRSLRFHLILCQFPP